MRKVLIMLLIAVIMYGCTYQMPDDAQDSISGQKSGNVRTDKQNHQGDNPADTISKANEDIQDAGDAMDAIDPVDITDEIEGVDVADAEGAEGLAAQIDEIDGLLDDFDDINLDELETIDMSDELEVTE